MPDFSHSVVIGVGGTGKWVVTYLKHKLEESNDGQLPNNIGLLSVDLAADEDPPVEIPTIENGAKTSYHLDYSRVSEEFHHFGQFWAKPIFSIQNAPDGKDHPYIRQWLLEDDASLYTIGPGDLSSIKGAGQRRQCSRICLFLDVEQDNITSKIKGAISTAASGLPAGQSVAIHIVGSLAGGTGCGSFVDIATLVQREALQQLPGGQIYLLGYFLLPKSFNAVATDRDAIPLMEGNCIAGLRELQRFMHFTNIPISYSDGLPLVQNQTRLFDVCYLMDGGRPPGSGGVDLSNTSPRLTLLPGIADYIFHHIAYSFPTDYAQVRMDINTKLHERRPQGAAIYSTFGIHQYIFDAKAVVDTFAHNLAEEALGCFLDNSPVGENQIAEEVHDFLRNGSNFNQTVLAYLSGSGTPNVEATSLFSTLRLGEGLDQTLPMLNLKERVSVESFFSKVPSQTVKNQTEGLIEANLGHDEDTLTPSGRNSYQAVLNWYSTQHSEQFRETVENRVLEIMRENDGQGSLQHALHFLRFLAGYDITEPGARGEEERVTHIEGRYERFHEMISQLYADRVATPRDLRNEALQAAGNAEDKMLQATRGLGNLQKRYLDAKQTELKYDQWQLVFDCVMEVAKGHKDICADLRDQIESWLSTFGDGQREVRQAYTALVDVRKAKAEIGVRTYVSMQGDEWENRLYDLLLGKKEATSAEKPLIDRLAKVNIQKILRNFDWRVEDNRLGCYLPAEYAPWDELRGNPILWNYTFINALLTEGYFMDITNITIMDVLALKGQDASALCNDLLVSSSPFATLNLQGHPPTRPWDTIYATVSANPPASGFSNQVQGILGDLNPSYSPHVICRYQAQHLLGMEAFGALQNAEAVYRNRIKDPKDGKRVSPPLHNFLAEKNAANYESKFPEALNEEVRNLDLAIVHLLEDEKVVRDFTLALYHELIATEFNVAENRNEYLCEVTDRTGKTEPVTLGDSLVAALTFVIADFLEQRDEKSVIEQLAEKSLAKDKERVDNEGLSDYGKALQEYVLNSPMLQTTPAQQDAESDLKRIMKIILWEKATQMLKNAPSTAATSP